MLSTHSRHTHTPRARTHQSASDRRREGVFLASVLLQTNTSQYRGTVSQQKNLATLPISSYPGPQTWGASSPGQLPSHTCANPRLSWGFLSQWIMPLSARCLLGFLPVGSEAATLGSRALSAFSWSKGFPGLPPPQPDELQQAWPWRAGPKARAPRQLFPRRQPNRGLD